MNFKAAGVAEALHHIELEVLAATRHGLGQGAVYAYDLARQTTAFKDGPDAALRSTIRTWSANDGFSAFVSAGDRRVFWAGFVEDGTKAHEIRPKRTGTVSSRRGQRASRALAPVLRFQIAGRWISARVVKHPGTKPAHFMLDARDKAEIATAQFIEAGISAVIGG